MSVTVKIPTPLRALTKGEDAVQAQGATVAEVIADLERRYPGFADRVLDGKGVRRFVNIYIGEDDIRFLDGLKSATPDGATLAIIPAVAGG
ncbi:MoaD/ThiS family protein [Streptomyces orinoci]|uniref:MoaD/ThiS family protein n=1 Tax=Streptomyces orinoci TaxID=67339 RepID=A0ABV3JTU4_STRON|nr:MoaD/ThiS family protein [Streptomyces orinoci]